ncbi:predicted protein [Nematostella vectensis]|uniref:Transmembrane protein 267 n=1 Tax=Nematostella vectensis TaxID=45351 RepID=A7RUC4_NEMVE|nr:transmembrane protein 267 [Nematostella vectensis]EDO45051.1 predicted protein [Nematostella vectensis]|eukprot:XP_001637114.1 predicted protein [Nematostella vectensis]
MPWFWEGFGFFSVFKKIIHILPYLMLASVCLVCDWLITVPIIHNTDPSRALMDNLAHGFIAGISWLIVVGISREGIIQSLGCSVLSCAIDVDHFFLARSWNLKDALSLTHRPPLHTTTIILLLVPLLQTWCAQHVVCLHLLPYMFTISVLSHHLRDAQRRGLWFWPIGSTPSLPCWLYVTCVMLLPFVLKIVIKAVESLPDNEELKKSPVPI